ncbi:glycosyltransferase [Stutzerimonas tarimensis]|uniref:Glycosyltransferase n=1 Tax=Stutzerimonas tarimensis TaxID=1507735 RepID=A0ABV7T005_9GAMM
MRFFPVFLSVVCVVRNQAERLEKTLAQTAELIAPHVSDYELIVIDNASDDNSVEVLKRLTGEQGLPNLQVYALTKEVGGDIAPAAGLENALGDYVAVMDPLTDDAGFLVAMLEQATQGTDVVFAVDESPSRRGVLYRGAYALFNSFYQRVNGIHLSKEAPQFRMLSKTVVNFILQHPQPALSYRHLPATGGFTRSHLSHRATSQTLPRKSLGESIDWGVRLLTSTTRAPMRLATSLALFGALANLLYSLYVVGVALIKPDVAPGWVSLSLLQSGMFFLVSLVLLVLAEYILHMSSQTCEGPAYHVAQEYTSARVARQEAPRVTPADAEAALVDTYQRRAI